MDISEIRTTRTANGVPNESKQECRKLQTANLLLQRERQDLLEQVACLECKLTQNHFKQPLESALRLLEEAQHKVQEVQVALKDIDSDIKLSIHSPNRKPIHTPKKTLQFSSPSHFEGATIYPRTPHPLQNMTRVVDGPQLASTPVEMSSNSRPMKLTPQVITFIDSEEDERDDNHLQQKPISEKCEPVSPIADIKGPQSLVPKNESKITDTTLDQLEEILTNETTDRRPRRKCVSLSMSYTEPTLNRKLRQGDHFTEQKTGWNPSSQRECTKRKNLTTGKKTTLQNITNQQK